MTYPLIKPGVLEVYCGPMKSGKTKEIINRIDKLRFMKDSDFIFIKPLLDTRDSMIKTRFGDLSYECAFVEENNPDEIIRRVEDKHKLVIIDEAQFFGVGIIQVIEKLLLSGRNIIVGGLDLDFRGEPFGQMPHLLSMAQEVYKLSAICEFKNCNSLANRTQRLIDKKPAEYNSPIVLIEGSGDETYEPRCLTHHFVPGKKDLI